MRIRFTPHAEDRLRLRKISRDLVEDTTNHPDQVVRGRFNRMIALKYQQGRTLKVVYEENSEKVIVTAYWIRRERVA